MLVVYAKSKLQSRHRNISQDKMNVVAEHVLVSSQNQPLPRCLPPLAPHPPHPTSLASFARRPLWFSKVMYDLRTPFFNSSLPPHNPLRKVSWLGKQRRQRWLPHCLFDGGASSLLLPMLLLLVRLTALRPAASCKTCRAPPAVPPTTSLLHFATRPTAGHTGCRRASDDFA